jgi:hypothetical protein
VLGQEKAAVGTLPPFRRKAAETANGAVAPELKTSALDPIRISGT